MSRRTARSSGVAPRTETPPYPVSLSTPAKLAGVFVSAQRGWLWSCAYLGYAAPHSTRLPLAESTSGGATRRTAEPLDARQRWQGTRCGSHG